MTSHRLLRLLLLLALLPTGWLAMPSVAHADVSCSATMTDMSFGTIDPQQAAGATTNASLKFTCQNNAFLQQAYVTACLNIGAGGSSSGNTSPRDMDGSAAPPLRFQIYTDAAHSTIWGSVATAGTNTPVMVQFTVPGAFLGNGTYTSPTYTAYGLIVPNQAGVNAGSYANSFSGFNASISGVIGNGGYPASCGNTPAIPFPFTATATVKPACTVSASDLNFGNIAGLLSGSNHDGTTTITAQCVNGTAYKIGLDNGQNAVGTTRRMAGPGGQLIQYELYRDPGLTQRWGNTPGTDTVDKTGSGSNQNATVYGRVPAQTTPSPGAYSDTITVNVTY